MIMTRHKKRKGRRRERKTTGRRRARRTLARNGTPRRRYLLEILLSTLLLVMGNLMMM
jgi:hypothetical protein